MNPRRFVSLRLARRAAQALLAAALAVGLALPAAAQEDPPARVAQLNLQQGTVSMSPSGDDSWYDAVPNRPLTTGDRLWTDRNARAELFVGGIALRMDEETSLEISELGDQTLRVTVSQGRLQVRALEALEGQRVEINTGNLAFVLKEPGDYRFFADPANDSTQVMVAQGGGTVFGEGGGSQEFGERQQAVFTGRDLAPGGAPRMLSDTFERWLAERNRVEEQSVSARYVTREMPGYQQLDAYGQWQNDPTYGAVWYPSNVATDWSPYSDGSWVYVAPWGMTWVDRAPWGFAPAHYGRWNRFGPRWGWVPGRPQGRPVYSPALVGFVGGAGAAFVVGANRPAVGWFPLGPGDTWRPGYRASDRYIERANRMNFPGRPGGHGPYVNRLVPNAVTALPADAFGRRPVGRGDFVRPPPQALAGVPVATRPPGWGNAGAGADLGFMGRRANAVPPPDLAQRQARQQANEQVRQMQDFQQRQRAAQLQSEGIPARRGPDPAEAQAQRQQRQQAQDQVRQMQDFQQRQRAAQLQSQGIPVRGRPDPAEAQAQRQQRQQAEDQVRQMQQFQQQQQRAQIQAAQQQGHAQRQWDQQAQAQRQAEQQARQQQMQQQQMQQQQVQQQAQQREQRDRDQQQRMQRAAPQQAGSPPMRNFFPGLGNFDNRP